MKLFFLILSLLSVFYVNGQISYDFDWKKESIILGGSGLMLGSSYLIDNSRELLSLEEILNSSPPVNSFERFAINNSSFQAKNASDVLFFITSALPMGLLASKKLKGKELGYLLMYGETIALNGGLTFLAKSATDRKRPYFYNSSFTIEERQDIDARKAFFSGHTSHTAALSFFTARIFSDLYPNSKWKKIIWSGAVILPAATAILRVQAGRHFPSDVVVGYGVGAGIGLLIPYLHRKNQDSDHTWKVSPSLNGLSIVYEL